MQTEQIAATLLQRYPLGSPLAQALLIVDTVDVPSVRNLLDPALAEVVPLVEAQRLMAGERARLDDLYLRLVAAYKVEGSGEELLKALQQERIRPHLRKGKPVIGYLRRVDRRQPDLPAAMPLHVVPVGTQLFHGTGEEFQGAKLAPGAYDGVAWFADRAIAQLYIPQEGATYHFAIDLLTRPSRDPDITRIQERLGLRFQDVRWGNVTDDAESFKYAPLPPEAWETWTEEVFDSPDAVDPREVIHQTDSIDPAWIYRRLTEERFIDPDDFTDMQGAPRKPTAFDGVAIRLNGGEPMRLGELRPGRLLKATVLEPLRIADLASFADYEGDEMNVEYHQVAIFRRLAAIGFDGVRINDFAQSRKLGNLHHLSIGLFPRGLRKIRLDEEPATYKEYEPQNHLAKAGAQLNLWGVIRPEARAEERPPEHERASGEQLSLWGPRTVEVQQHVRRGPSGPALVAAHLRHVEGVDAPWELPAVLAQAAGADELRAAIKKELDERPMNSRMVEELLDDSAALFGHWPPASMAELAQAIGLTAATRATNPSLYSVLTVAMGLGADPDHAIRLINKINAAGWYKAPALQITDEQVRLLQAAKPWTWEQDPLPRGKALKEALAVWMAEHDAELAKAEQMALALGKRVEEVPVKAHLRRTATKISPVVAHLRSQEVSEQQALPTRTVFRGWRGYQPDAAKLLGGDVGDNARFGPALYYADSEAAAKGYAAFRGPGAAVEQREISMLASDVLDIDAPDPASPHWAALKEQVAALGVSTGTMRDAELGIDLPGPWWDWTRRAMLKRDPKIATDPYAFWAGTARLAAMARAAGYKAIRAYNEGDDGIPPHTELALLEPLEGGRQPKEPQVEAKGLDARYGYMPLRSDVSDQLAGRPGPEWSEWATEASRVVWAKAGAGEELERHEVRLERSVGPTEIWRAVDVITVIEPGRDPAADPNWRLRSYVFPLIGAQFLVGLEHEPETRFHATQRWRQMIELFENKRALEDGQIRAGVAKLAKLKPPQPEDQDPRRWDAATPEARARRVAAALEVGGQSHSVAWWQEHPELPDLLQEVNGEGRGSRPWDASQESVRVLGEMEDAGLPEDLRGQLLAPGADLLKRYAVGASLGKVEGAAIQRRIWEAVQDYVEAMFDFGRHSPGFLPKDHPFALPADGQQDRRAATIEAARRTLHLLGGDALVSLADRAHATMSPARERPQKLRADLKRVHAAMAPKIDANGEYRHISRAAATTREARAYQNSVVSNGLTAEHEHAQRVQELMAVHELREGLRPFADHRSIVEGGPRASLLLKAGTQLSLFDRPAHRVELSAVDQARVAAEEVRVRGHVRAGPSGPEIVKPHTRRVGAKPGDLVRMKGHKALYKVTGPDQSGQGYTVTGWADSVVGGLPDDADQIEIVPDIGPPPEDKSTISFDPSLFEPVGEARRLKISGLGVPTTGYNPNRREWRLEEREAADRYARAVGGTVVEVVRPVQRRLAWTLADRPADVLPTPMEAFARAQFTPSTSTGDVEIEVSRGDAVAMEQVKARGLSWWQGTVRSELVVHRVVDEEELDLLARAGEAGGDVAAVPITGGHFAVPAERNMGASWSADPEGLLTSYLNVRGPEIGTKRFLLTVDLNGERAGGLQLQAGRAITEGRFHLQADTITAGLGISAKPPVRKVLAREIDPPSAGLLTLGGRQLGGPRPLEDVLKDNVAAMKRNPERAHRFEVHEAAVKAAKAWQAWTRKSGPWGAALPENPTKHDSSNVAKQARRIRGEMIRQAMERAATIDQGFLWRHGPDRAAFRHHVRTVIADFERDRREGEPSVADLLVTHQIKWGEA